ncbi:MAG: 1-acyl-sn-glycerol-3-phosphate acyltransferase [Acidobacteria bacterium]|nr:MAG: 1-acyl-sn-glycerol-3-phosphate acyltransferase [Acidobacteriota bacterium]PYV73237.1 MAG: 1-acyl-sn-glycerol-3-phosphate acyltransferase [Acidobacteriota bacterium]
MLGFWAVLLPIAALTCFPWVLITGDIRPLYRVGMWGARTGVRLAGIRVRIVGLEQLDARRTYVFMSNHVSNIDPPVLLPRIPGRTSVMAKQELFNVPILGKAMRMASLVPVNRGDRDAGVSAVRNATQVVKQGIHMTIFVEGHRSFDGKLLPFKKGPFYLAQECHVPVVPVTISGSHFVMPKGRFAMKGGTVTLIFHQPIEPEEFGTREALMEKVRAVISSGLPPEYQS